LQKEQLCKSESDHGKSSHQELRPGRFDCLGSDCWYLGHPGGIQTRILGHCGISFEEVYYTLVAKCRDFFLDM